MKKTIFPFIFASAILASQVWADKCSNADGNLYCEYDAKNCHSINNDYAPNIGADCADLIAACEKDGALYIGVKDNLLQPQYTDPPTADVTCSEAGGTQIGGAENCGANYCMWDECTLIKADPEGEYGEATATCADAIANCDLNGSGRFSDATCNTPVSVSSSSSSTPVPSSSSRVSSSSTPAPSSSSVTPQIAQKGYYIFEHNPSARDNYPTAYNAVEENQYIFGFSYADKDNFKNPEDDYGNIWIDQGVAKLKEATFGAAPGAANNYESHGSALALKNNPAGETPNISDCTNGFSYFYKGEAHSFNLDFSGEKCGTEDGDGSNKWGVASIPAATSWTLRTIQPSQISLYNTWTGENPSQCNATNAGTVELGDVTQMVWELSNKLSPNKTVSLMITNIACLNSSGETLDGAIPSNTITVNTGKVGGELPSSSSNDPTFTYCIDAANNKCYASGPYTEKSCEDAVMQASNTCPYQSSSSGGAGGTYAYCVYITEQLCLEGPYTSCSQNGILSNSCPTFTPIVLSSVSGKNALQAMRSAVNLQVTGNTSLQIFDLKGKEIRSLKFKQGNYVVQLADLPRGLYIVKASSASWKQTVKMAVR